ncbi:MAG: c-type cytochrome [Candidatus Loosdrechtia sp.]|uniref:c-type cytochrome n=1 Tax=Candidatus Loosdrechtia sp. TaxID=3101272 RepID=UPI003A656D43|nr:MAG: c-type cytochrome [Candidatus Jettenia sp. AMX2]
MMGYFSRRKKILARLIIVSSIGMSGIWTVSPIVSGLDVPPNPREMEFLLTPKKTFEYYCSPCHGAQGKGDGTFFTIDLKPKPRNLADADYTAKRTDDELMKAISGGSRAVDKSNLCPPWGGTLSEKKIKELVAYIRSFSQQEAEKPVTVAKEHVTEAAQNNVLKTSIRWFFLLVVAFGLVAGAASELKKLRNEKK